MGVLRQDTEVDFSPGGNRGDVDDRDGVEEYNVCGGFERVCLS